MSTKVRHLRPASGVTKASLRGRHSLKVPSPLGVGLRRCGGAARARPQASSRAKPPHPKLSENSHRSDRPGPRAGLGVPPPHAAYTPPGPPDHAPAPAVARATPPSPESPSLAGGGRGGMGRGAREAEPSRGILLPASAGPSRAAWPSEGSRVGGGGEPQTPTGREGNAPSEPPPPPPRRPRGLRGARRVFTPPAASPRGPAVRSPARLPRAMQPPPALRA